MRKNKFYPAKHNKFLKFKIKAAIIGVILIVGIIIFFPHFFRNTYVVTIANKQIERRNNSDRYLIYAQMEDGTLKVFENTNSLVEFKLNSVDVYGGLRINVKYQIKTYGFRIPPLSCYQNIVKIKAVK